MICCALALYITSRHRLKCMIETLLHLILCNHSLHACTLESRIRPNLTRFVRSFATRLHYTCTSPYINVFRTWHVQLDAVAQKYKAQLIASHGKTHIDIKIYKVWNLMDIFLCVLYVSLVMVLFCVDCTFQYHVKINFKTELIQSIKWNMLKNKHE